MFLFDLDGTIIDSDQMLVETFYELYELYKPGVRPPREYVLQFSGPPLKESLKKEFPHIDVVEAEKKFREFSKKHYYDSVTVFPYAAEFIANLRKQNKKTAIITSKLRKPTLFTLKLTKLAPLFDLVIAGDDVKNLKPSPEGIYKALDFFEVKDLSKVLYIGDTNFDYLAARNAQIKFAIVSWTPRPLISEARPHYVVKDFKHFEKELLNV